MKALKIIGIVILALFIVFVGVSFFLPSNYKVERSITINATPQTVYEEVADFRNEPHWSPWLEMDTTTKTELSGTPMQPGAAMKWSSKKMGDGTETLEEAIPYKSLKYTLAAGGMKSSIVWTFEPLSNDSIRATWTITGDLSFFHRCFALMADKMMGNVFEHGLAKLKEYCEHNPKVETGGEAKGMRIEMNNVPAQHVMTIQQSCNSSELSPVIGKAYGQIIDYMKAKGIQQVGAPFCIFHFYSKDSVSLEPGIFTDKLGKSQGNINAYDMKPSNVVVATYYGPYSGIEATVMKVVYWINENHKHIIGHNWDVFVTDPRTEPDSTKWETKIYYPVE